MALQPRRPLLPVSSTVGRNDGDAILQGPLVDLQLQPWNTYALFRTCWRSGFVGMYCKNVNFGYRALFSFFI